MPVDDLKWAISRFDGSERRARIALYNAYYDGEHRFNLATEGFKNRFAHLFKEFADNLCPTVVDALGERLKITGWTSSEAKTVTEDVAPPGNLPGLAPYQKVTVTDPWGEAAQKLWDENEMPSRAGEIHREAIKCGDSYLLIWPNKQMQVEFYPQTAAEMEVEYDANEFGVLARATKLWWLPAQKKYRLNIYLPDRIEKYITLQESPNGLPGVDSGWIRFVDPAIGDWWVENPYGVVPVFHFAHRACYRSGRSDLKDVVPIQDALNKSVVDLLVAMEYASYKQRYIIGLEPEIDETTGEPVDRNVKDYGVDRMMGIPGDKGEIEVGQFEATDLSQFTGVSDDFRKEVSRVSGRPLHYFFITTGDYPSGEAIKSSEARFTGIIEDAQELWDPPWGSAMEFALNISNALPDGLDLDPVWKPAAPRTEAEIADSAVKKKTIGVSRSQLLKELGYDDETILRMLQETDAHEQMQAVLKAEASGPDQATATPAGSGGGTPTAVNNAASARRAGRVPGVRS